MGQNECNTTQQMYRGRRTYPMTKNNVTLQGKNSRTVCQTVCTTTEDSDSKMPCNVVSECNTTVSCKSTSSCNTASSTNGKPCCNEASSYNMASSVNGKPGCNARTSYEMKKNINLSSTMGVCNQNCKQLKCLIDQISFAMDDTRLYLDTHPDCQEAIDYYKKMKKMRNEALEQHRKHCGPMVSYEAGEDDCESWNWVNAPLPWENMSCNGRRG